MARILVVDDNEDACETLAAWLRALSHEATCVTDPRRAVEVARSWRPSVACLDIGMPHIDGFQLAALFRHDNELRSVCLIAVTAWSDGAMRERIMAAGFHRHLVKPPQIEGLAEAIASWSAAAEG